MHGQIDLFWEAFAATEISVAKGDIVVCVGDLIDRGPSSYDCVKLLEKSWFFSVLGNHEELFLHAWNEKFNGAWTKEWFENGGGWHKSLAKDVVDDVADKLLNLPLTAEIIKTDGKRFGIVHAEYPFNEWGYIDKNDSVAKDIENLLRGRSFGAGKRNKLTQGIYATLHGHTIFSKAPVKQENTIFIDAGAAVNRLPLFLEINTIDLNKINRIKTGEILQKKKSICPNIEEIFSL